jgi:hypothetical protein
MPRQWKVEPDHRSDGRAPGPGGVDDVVRLERAVRRPDPGRPPAVRLDVRDGRVRVDVGARLPGRLDEPLGDGDRIGEPGVALDGPDCDVGDR